MKTNQRQEGSWLMWGLGFLVSALFTGSVVLAMTVEPPRFSGYGIERYRQVADTSPLGGYPQKGETRSALEDASSPAAPGATFFADAGYIMRIGGQ